MKLILTFLLAFSTSVMADTILFLGDSLTEGYQLPKEDAYPAVIERTLKKTVKDIKVINGGVSGATSASGLKRMDWYLKAKPDFMVLALGANDGLRGMKIDQTEKNLAKVIEKAQERGITVVLAGMKMPTNYGEPYRTQFENIYPKLDGEPYRTQFENIYPKLAKKYSLKLIPFILDGVGGQPEYNLPDGIHPNPKGHEIMAKNVLKVLGPLL